MLIALGIILIVMSYDFISAFISIELQTLCFYIILSISKINKTIEASIKYFILGSFSTAIFLLGVSFIYFSTGLTNFKDLSDFLLLNDNLVFLPIIKIGFILICIAFFFKLSLAPFHF
jgi:NADH-quinone oxidoreductase subunit N